MTVLQPIKKMGSIHVTALASLAGNKPGAAANAPVKHEIRVQRLSKEQAAAEQRSAVRLRAIAKERGTAQVKVAARPPAVGSPPVKVQQLRCRRERRRRG